MKLIFNTLILLLAKATFGQLADSLFSKANVYGNIVTLTRIDSISKDMIIGNFHTSDGFCGHTYLFKTDFQFAQNQHCCRFDSTIGKGRWLIENRNSVVLKSDIRSIQFSMFKLNNYYFLVKQQEQQAFIDDLNKTVVRVNKKKFLKKMESEAYRSFLTVTILSQNYYSSQIL